MEFGIGLVTGGVLGGLAFAKSGAVVNALHSWLASEEGSLKAKIAARLQAFKSKV